MSKLFKRAICSLIILITVCTGFSMYAFAATTVTVLDGKVSITDTATSMSESGGTVTVTAKGGLLSQTTNTITITNDSGVKAKLTFTYSASNYSSFSQSSASGSHSADLEAGASMTMSIKGKRALSGNTATLTLSGFSLVPISASSNVTFTYDSTYGSITVDGTATANDAVVNIPSSGAALAATPVSGATFYGWVDAADGRVLSTSASYTLTPAQDMTVQAVFVGANSAPWFGVGSGTSKTQGYSLGNIAKFTYHAIASYTHLFDNLNTAATTAASAGKYVVLLNSGTLPAGDYTIPSGVTLLIPFDSANTCYSSNAQWSDTYTEPSAYRTLTMASGANIIINGAMSVSAKHRYTQGAWDKNMYGGAPTGSVGFVRMENNSNITVNNGGVLYCYGFITGSGNVTAFSGGSVYENFQITDFRGGDQSSGMENSVFPVSQYYVQNIEVPLTLHSGAKEYGYTTVNASSAYIASQVAFIGPSGTMFNLSSGTLTKKYDGSTDRLLVELNGTISISSVELDLNLAAINSEKYVLPINNNISIVVKSNSSVSINQDLAIIPGVRLEIEKDASITLGSGISIYVYDSDTWGEYCHSEQWFRAAPYAPSRTYTRTTADLVDAQVLVNGTIDASAGYLYTTASGANIYSTGAGVVKVNPGSAENTYQFTQSNTTYVKIPVTSAQLKNADGSYVQSVKDTYTYVDGFWRCANHTFENGICTVCGIHLFTIEASQIFLGNNLDMAFRFVYNGAGTDDLSGYTVKLTHADADNKTVTYSLDSQDYPWYKGTDDDGTSYYYVVYKGLAARRMCDTISLAVYSGDTQVSKTWTDSMREYAMRMLEDTTDADAKKRTVLVDMLNYGAEAQKHFKYNTGSLANAELTDAQKAYATATVPDRIVPESSLGGNWRKSNLVTTSNIQFLMAIEGLNLNSNVTVSYTNHRDVSKNPSPIIGQAGDYYYVAIEELVVADAWCLVTVTVDGVEYKDSIAGYLKRYTGESAVYDAYWKFADSAYAYFHPDK